MSREIISATNLSTYSTDNDSNCPPCVYPAEDCNLWRGTAVGCSFPVEWIRGWEDVGTTVDLSEGVDLSAFGGCDVSTPGRCSSYFPFPLTVYILYSIKKMSLFCQPTPTNRVV